MLKVLSNAVQRNLLNDVVGYCTFLLPERRGSDDNCDVAS